METSIVFNIIESIRTETITYSTGDTSSQVIEHQGIMTAVLTFDPRTQRPTTIRFTGGILHQSPSTFENTADIHIYGQGTKRVGFVQSSSGIQIKTNTIGLAYPIANDGRMLETERLQSHPIAGTLTATLTMDGRSQTQSIDIATNPPDKVEPRERKERQNRVNPEWH